MVEHAADFVTILGAHADALFEDLEHRRRHAGVNLEAHRVAEPAPPQLLFDRQQEVVRLVFLELEIGVARHPEEVRFEDRHARKEHVQVGRDDLLDQDEFARLDLDQARQQRRHLDPGKTLLAVVRILDPDRE